jgi:hypothetical protein
MTKATTWGGKTSANPPHTDTESLQQDCGGTGLESNETCSDVTWSHGHACHLGRELEDRGPLPPTVAQFGLLHSLEGAAVSVPDSREWSRFDLSQDVLTSAPCVSPTPAGPDPGHDRPGSDSGFDLRSFAFAPRLLGESPTMEADGHVMPSPSAGGCCGSLSAPTRQFLC